MYSSTSLWVIAILMSSILQAHAGRPSSPAPQQPQQSPPADPDSATPPTNPTNTSPPSENTPPADENNAAQPGFLSTTGGQATAVVGGLVTLGVGAVAAKKGYKEYHAYQLRKVLQQKQVLRNFANGLWGFPAPATHCAASGYPTASERFICAFRSA